MGAGLPPYPAEVPSGVTSYVDSGTIDGVTYYYGVTALAGEVESQISPIASASSQRDPLIRVIIKSFWSGGRDLVVLFLPM